MATETPEQSASLAEVSRSFFTDPAGLPHSKNKDTGSYQTSRMCENQAHLRTAWSRLRNIFLSAVESHQNHWKEVFVERRPHFLLPGVAHAGSVVATLETNGIERKYTHVIAASGQANNQGGIES